MRGDFAGSERRGEAARLTGMGPVHWDPEDRGPPRLAPCGPWPVQLRHPTALTSEEYVRQQSWQQASLDRCPLHRSGGCGFARHGTYARVKPAGTLVARWYCPTGRTTFSLLPDCLASRLSGDLDTVEEVVAAVETKAATGASIERAAGEIRPDIELPGAVRWVRRRLGPVRMVLLALVTLLPGQVGTEARVLGVRDALGTKRALVRLREMGERHLGKLAPPIGFGPRARTRSRRRRRTQHETGPDPPTTSR